MGYSITHETAEKINNLRIEDRLCRGSTSSGRECLTRSTRKVLVLRWINKVNEGPTSEGWLTMCKRHADQMNPGYTGTNFVVKNHWKF